MADNNHRRRTSAEPGPTPGISRPISRRTFLAGTVAAGAAAAVVSSVGLTGCGSSRKKGETPNALSPSASDVTAVGDAYEEADEATLVTGSATYTLPAGTLLWADSNTYAATLMPGSTSTPLNSIGLTSLANGTCTEVLHEAVGASDGYSIYNVRANDSLVVWSELNFLTDDWRIYMASLRGTTMGTAVQLDEGTGDYEVPPLAVAPSTAVWVRQPSENGKRTTETTHVYSQPLSSSSATEICSSRGRLATLPHVNGNILTITPRVNTSSVYYRMLACDPINGSEISSAVLPTPIKPLDVVWTGSGFAFSVEASYDSGGALGGYGSYLQQGQGFLRLGRIPLDGPVWVGSNLVCKSGSNVTVLNTNRRQYCTVSALSGCASYGDCFATNGSGDQLVIYTTVSRAADHSDAQVQMRVLQLA